MNSKPCVLSIIFLALMTTRCNDGLNGNNTDAGDVSSSDGDADSDADADTDADGDADADADADTDADSDTGDEDIGSGGDTDTNANTDVDTGTVADADTESNSDSDTGIDPTLTAGACTVGAGTQTESGRTTEQYLGVDVQRDGQNYRMITNGWGQILAVAIGFESWEGPVTELSLDDFCLDIH
jgi:hypothetical protein